MNKLQIIQLLFNNKPLKIPFCDDINANNLIKDLENYPHAFVLACVMDRGMDAKKVWAIPYKFFSAIGSSSYNFKLIENLKLKHIKIIFKKYILHNRYHIMAEYFFKTIQRIKTTYQGDASKIWEGNKSSASIVKEFLQFDGVGLKIATMATNILKRDFKIEMSDTSSIEISTDTHIIRVLTRLGFVETSKKEEIIYWAREINQKYPGKIDYTLWYLGKHICQKKRPMCVQCYLNKYCPKIDVIK